MNETLFDGKQNITKDIVLKRMKYYIEMANNAMQTFETDRKVSFEIAKELRTELEKEYKNNNLKRIEDKYDNNIYFNFYRPAVHDTIASITGRLTYNNLYSFLYDIDYYMRYYIPNSDK